MEFTFNGVIPDNIIYNGNDLMRVTCNNVTVWEKIPGINQPLTMQATVDNTEVWLFNYGSNNADIWYKKNNGRWIKWEYSQGLGGYPTIPLDTGEYVSFKGNNPNGFNHGNGKYYTINATNPILCNGNVMSLIDNGACTTRTIPCAGCFAELFSLSADVQTGAQGLITAPLLPATNLTEYCYWGMFSGNTALITPPKFYTTVTTAPKSCFERMFYDCYSLTSVPKLPYTTVSDSSYQAMFYYCKSLTTIPTDLLPATTLGEKCYFDMFYSCSRLKNLPTLPATTLASYCYYGMFQHCIDITTIPNNYLPATIMQPNCYYGMFQYCTSLSTVPQDLLPSTTLAYKCYYRMFYDCESLTTAPDLLAPALVADCYGVMFGDCKNLNYVKCLATSYSNPYDLYEWLVDVSLNGTFVKDANSTIWIRGYSGIPQNWTVINV